jgi:hypothetical protein
MVEWITNIVALVMNPVSLLVFLILSKHLKTNKGKDTNDSWARHQGRGN